MKFQKKSNNLQDLFLQNAKILTEGFREMHAAVHAFCQHDTSSMNLHATKVIELENHQDSIREQIVKLLFTKETMVFSRPDRLDIIEFLDKIGDETEVIVQRLLLYHPVPESEFASKLDNFATKVGSLGNDLEGLIVTVFQDFSQTFPIVDKIQLLRGEIRNDHWVLLKWSYEHNSHPQEFYYYQTLIKDLCRVADLTEEFSDFIRSLLCKYS